MSRAVRTRRVGGLALLVAVLALPACGDAAPAPAAGTAPAPSAVGGENAPVAAEETGAGRSPARKPVGVRFEAVLQRLPNLPRIPVQLVPHHDGGSFFVLGRNGDLFHYDRPLESFPLGKETYPPGTDKYGGRITKVKIDGSYEKGDMGTLSLTLDPDFVTNGFFYVWYADKPDKNVALDRFTWGKDPAAVVASRTNVIRFSRRDPPAPYHMGGVAKFLPDKTLVLMIGDAERPELSQDRKDLNGKMLRIRPKPEGGYEVPADNPHVGDPAWAPEIVCHGLRAPFRGFLRKGKELWFGDVGSVFEEINVWSGGAQDFGWGRGHLTDGPDVPAGAEKPLVWWSQARDYAAEDPDYEGETRLSAGFGVIYEDVAQDRYAGFLTGKGIFFDIMRGWIRAGRITDDRKIVDHAHIGHRAFVADMVLGRDGYVYGVTWDAPVSLFRLRLADEIKKSPKPAASAPAEPAGPRREHAAGAASRAASPAGG